MTSPNQGADAGWQEPELFTKVPPREGGTCSGARGKKRWRWLEQKGNITLQQALGTDPSPRPPNLCSFSTLPCLLLG